MKYILNLDKLQIGDIILSTEGDKAALIGEEKTGSKYTHAMLYVGIQINHATLEGGVYSINPQRILFDSLTDVKVLRLKRKENETKLQSICDYTASKTGSIYSIKEALYSLPSTKLKTKKQKTNKQFCSRLIAQAYNYQKIRIAKNPDFCLPSDIEKSSNLVVVTHCLREANPSDISFYNKEDPLLLNQKTTYDWLFKVRKLAHEELYEIQTITDVGLFLCKYPKYDEIVCNYIKESGYLENHDIDTKINPYRYDFDLFMDHFLKNKINIKFDFRKEPSLVMRYRKQLQEHTSNYVKNRNNFDYIHIELYLNLLKLAEKRLTLLVLIAEDKIAHKTKNLIQDIQKSINLTQHDLGLINDCK